jgi:hypothetical protein
MAAELAPASLTSERCSHTIRLPESRGRAKDGVARPQPGQERIQVAPRERPGEGRATCS